MCEQKTVIHEHIFGPQGEPLKIKLMKMSKGYQWEISASGSDMKEILRKLRDADAALKHEWGGA